jgi:hypothetical protein
MSIRDELIAAGLLRVVPPVPRGDPSPQPVRDGPCLRLDRIGIQEAARVLAGPPWVDPPRGAAQ